MRGLLFVLAIILSMGVGAGLAIEDLRSQQPVASCDDLVKKGDARAVSQSWKDFNAQPR